MTIYDDDDEDGDEDFENDKDEDDDVEDDNDLLETSGGHLGDIGGVSGDI